MRRRRRRRGERRRRRICVGYPQPAHEEEELDGHEDRVVQVQLEGSAGGEIVVD